MTETRTTHDAHPPAAGLDGLNAADAGRLTPVLTDLSGSAAWARAIVDARPFPTVEALHTTARDVLACQDDDEVIAAVDAHPPIGTSGPVSTASAREQSAAARADADTARRLAEGQQRYAEHFGHGFLVCATGLTAEQVLAEVRRRLALTPKQDLAATREHLARINALRLDHLLESGTL
ncbi:2-oxo-4-hydroxy-4-carboxy-5-ureidoimidazoline decarboxylase [Rhodococcus sp. IEGM 1408]|uniref:2-oxo-4-hydroxy-4-carboxy-5-ureidoimidazoline decarboxylase n=1 Tax=Rhodococcus sp. IEGM 1408 TaxID=3082220 RepID=UPI0029541D3D|nr:2-oxo-4-hydroxy-4-carboxy-5-ureidoimidazoline decarboxylase [Rhodococcus sp. IEGM 1408]MDV8001494.1 2-oxo-4-hydroxy-4-carboxy-5-ureidoimidazoline decarboxylase [Rhodococcus sp. IEGM 1408]